MELDECEEAVEDGISWQVVSRVMEWAVHNTSDGLLCIKTHHHDVAGLI